VTDIRIAAASSYHSLSSSHHRVRSIIIIQSSLHEVAFPPPICVYPEGSRGAEHLQHHPIGGNFKQTRYTNVSRPYHRSRAPVFLRPARHLRLPKYCGVRTRPPVPRAVVLPRPLQQLQVPAHCGAGTSQCAPWAVVQSCSRAHFNTSRCPPLAAYAQVLAQGQPRSHANFRTSRCPPLAANEQVNGCNGQSCSSAHFNTSRCPPSAANCTNRLVPRAVVIPRPPQHLHVPPQAANIQVLSFHGHPFSLAQTSRSTDPTKSFTLNETAPRVFVPACPRPEASTAALQPRPTRANTARSHLWDKKGAGS